MEVANEKTNIDPFLSLSVVKQKKESSCGFWTVKRGSGDYLESVQVAQRAAFIYVFCACCTGIVEEA